MIVGLPREIKEDEARVGLTPQGVNAFARSGHRVVVQRGAGLLSGILDESYAAAGAELVDDAAELWHRADMVVKVKEPVGPERRLLREGQILFCYLHLASDESLTRSIVESGCVAVAYETVQLADGSLPLLMPMSEVAGRLAAQKGAQCLEAINGGKGILMSGVSGVKPANVVVLGAGIAGTNACFGALGMEARVTVLDTNPAKLRHLHDITRGHISTLMSNSANIAAECTEADLVIGTVLVPGARTPRLIPRELVREMQQGSVIVDVAVDQGGCAETSRPTTHHAPTFIVDGVVHYCVANMPGAVPKTSTLALTNVTLSYGLELADQGAAAAARGNTALRRGFNVCRGHVTHPAVAETFGYEHREPEEVLG